MQRKEDELTAHNDDSSSVAGLDVMPLGRRNSNGNSFRCLTEAAVTNASPATSSPTAMMTEYDNGDIGSGLWNHHNHHPDDVPDNNHNLHHFHHNNTNEHLKSLNVRQLQASLVESHQLSRLFVEDIEVDNLGEEMTTTEEDDGIVVLPTADLRHTTRMLYDTDHLKLRSSKRCHDGEMDYEGSDDGGRDAEDTVTNAAKRLCMEQVVLSL